MVVSTSPRPNGASYVRDTVRALDEWGGAGAADHKFVLSDGGGALTDLGWPVESYERRVITETLKRHDCNVAKASEALGLGSRQTLYKKLKRLAIDIGDFLQEDTEPGMQYRA